MAIEEVERLEREKRLDNAMHRMRMREVEKTELQRKTELNRAKHELDKEIIAVQRGLKRQHAHVDKVGLFVLFPLCVN